ncbi:oligosaccharide flippase family protein [Flavobacterium sp.]|jgi:O-antigen/teichoic acid export membrane protein|uniref:oligosaccharide flippase family protein n=1 Tax=Flavobacterium sp. TaxID=239 RepID=UPI0037BE6F1D
MANTLIIKFKLLLNSPTIVRLLAGTGWSLTGEILSKGLLFLSWIIVARLLGKVGYGQFGIIRSTITMFAIFGGLGLGLTANKFVAENRSSNKLFAGQIIGMTQIFAFVSGLLLAGLILIFSNYIAITLLKAPFLENELKLTAIMLFFSSINGAQIGILQGLEAYKKLALLNAIQGVTAFPLFALGTYYFGLSGSISAFALNIIISTLLFQIVIQKELKLKGIVVYFKNIKDTISIFWSFSLPAALTGIAVSPFKWYSEALLVKFSGFDNLGIFQAAIVISSIVIAIASTLNAPLISIAANSSGNKSDMKLQYITMYSSWYAFLILSVPFLIFPKILIFLFGDQFNDPNLIKTSILMLLWCGMMLYYQGITRFIMLNNSIWFLFSTNIFEGLTLIGAFYFFRTQGALGLGYAYVLSYVIRIIISLPYIYIKKLMPNKILFDKYFWISVTLFFTIVFFLIK